MEIIDLNTLPDYKGFNISIYDANLIKSNKLITEVVRHKNKTGQNFMMIPVSIYNLLENNPAFDDSKSLESNDLTIKLNSLIYVGSIYGIDVYLDFYLPSDTIILKYDKSVMRDKKIDSILNDTEINEDIEIRVLNYYY